MHWANNWPSFHILLTSCGGGPLTNHRECKFLTPSYTMLLCSAESSRQSWPLPRHKMALNMASHQILCELARKSSFSRGERTDRGGGESATLLILNFWCSGAVWNYALVAPRTSAVVAQHERGPPTVVVREHWVGRHHQHGTHKTATVENHRVTSPCTSQPQ